MGRLEDVSRIRETRISIAVPDRRRRRMLRQPAPARGRPQRQALIRIVLADLSMSLDNVLAVAGIARDHFWLLAFGLVLSVALMGVASTCIARLLDRFFWISWVGLGIVTFVALRMIWDGSAQILHQTAALSLLGSRVVGRVRAAVTAPAGSGSPALPGGRCRRG